MSAGGPAGLAAYEDIAVSIFNPRAVKAVVKTTGRLLFERTLPGHPEFSLTAYYAEGRVDVDLCGKGRPDPIKHIVSLTDAGLDWTQKGNAAGMTPAVRLCHEAVNERAVRVAGPPHFERLMKDRFWQRFLDELPGAFTVASVLLA